MAQRRGAWRNLVALALLLQACVPFALPPAEVQVGYGARRNTSPAGALVDGPVQLRAAIDPFAVMKDRGDRLVDVSAGAFFDLAAQDPTRGGFVDLGLIPWTHPIGESGLMRFEPRLQGRLIYDPDTHAFGEGIAAQLSLDLVNFTDGNFETSGGGGGAFGYLFGEGGVGLYVEAAYGIIHEQRLASISGGFEIKIPAMFGFAWGIPH